MSGAAGLLVKSEIWFNLIMYIYTDIIKPILTYGATVWWPESQ